jgi:hypothetical protein
LAGWPTSSTHIIRDQTVILRLRLNNRCCACNASRPSTALSASMDGSPPSRTRPLRALSLHIVMQALPLSPVRCIRWSRWIEISRYV